MSDVRIATVSALPDGQAVRVEAEGVALAVVRFGERVYAIDDTCSHADYSLSEGDVYADELELECPQHGSAFSLVTGEPSCLPATQPVRVHPVRVDGEEVWVSLP